MPLTAPIRTLGGTVAHLFHDKRHGPRCQWCSHQLERAQTPVASRKFHPIGSDLVATGDPIHKRALLVGIDYLDDKANRLRGCINDANNIHQFVTTYLGYTDTRVLCDDRPQLLPTRANLLTGIEWLLAGAISGDHLFFHYSGHGTRQKDRDGDEHDGFDEVLVPCDFRRAGYISDDELYDRLVDQVPDGVTLTVVMDCCHSGTMLDLPRTYRSHRGAIIRRTQQKYVNGRVVCVSAAMDTQTATDVASTDQKPAHGALTHALMQTMANKQYRVTLKYLLKTLTTQLHTFQQTPCVSLTDNVKLEEFYFGIENH